MAIKKPVAKQHVAIGIWQGITVTDPKGLLDGSRFYKVTDPAKYDEKAVVERVKQASRARA